MSLLTGIAKQPAWQPLRLVQCSQNLRETQSPHAAGEVTAELSHGTATLRHEGQNRGSSPCPRP